MTTEDILASGSMPSASSSTSDLARSIFLDALLFPTFDFSWLALAAILYIESYTVPYLEW